MHGDDGERHVGRIKTFNSKHGFGFVDCPRAFGRWQRDVFIHRAQMGDLEVGDEISFAVWANKDGMPQARDIVRMDGRPHMMPGRSRRRRSEDRRRGDGRGGDPKFGDGGGSCNGGMPCGGGPLVEASPPLGPAWWANAPAQPWK